MAYTKTTWVDGVTPVNASNMNKIEQGIYDVSPINEGTNGQVLTKTENGAEWKTSQTGGVTSVNNVEPDANGNVTLNALNILYDNSTSELIANDLQAAIDELVARVKALEG